MNGLLSDTPSPGAIRLTVGGFLLQFVQTIFLLLAPEIAGDLRMLIWLVTLLSGASLIGALCGLPTARDWRRFRDR
jgi:hypothetical protein